MIGVFFGILRVPSNELLETCLCALCLAEGFDIVLFCARLCHANTLLIFLQADNGIVEQHGLAIAVVIKRSLLGL